MTSDSVNASAIVRGQRMLPASISRGESMDRNEAEQIAWKILAEVEETMSDEGVGILGESRNDGLRLQGHFHDSE